jgi:hypothetical protein
MFGDSPPMVQIPRFKRVVKRSHHTDAHDDTDPIVDSLSIPDLPSGAISQISCDMRIRQQTLSEW